MCVHEQRVKESLARDFLFFFFFGGGNVRWCGEGGVNSMLYLCNNFLGGGGGGGGGTWTFGTLVSLPPQIAPLLANCTSCMVCPNKGEGWWVLTEIDHYKEVLPASVACFSCSSAALRLLTYVAWCLLWCSSMISPDMVGSSALYP